MNSRRNQIIKVGIIFLVVVLLGMMLTHCTNTTETKSVKLDKIVEKSKKKVNTKKPEKNKSIDVDKAPDQEEKKEETSKTNTSESKKDNTASTSSSSNKNNSSSSSTKPSSKPSNSGSNNSSSSKPFNSSGSSSNSSKPAEHKHDWVAQYKTVNVPEKGHNEQVLVQTAYDEQVPITEMQEFTFCNDCGANITGFASDHILNGTCRRYYTDWREVTTGYNTVHHEAVYETRYVVDSPATKKQELTGYKCSSCGKTRAN